jgi:hypothetical protein
MERHDQVGVYAGEHSACIRLQLALVGQDILAEVETFEADEFGVNARVYVPTKDLEKAAAVVQTLS